MAVVREARQCFIPSFLLSSVLRKKNKNKKDIVEFEHNKMSTAIVTEFRNRKSTEFSSFLCLKIYLKTFVFHIKIVPPSNALRTRKRLRLTFTEVKLMAASLNPECNKQKFPEQSAPIAAISNPLHAIRIMHINCIATDDAIAREQRKLIKRK